jgi:iron complex outermembrane recepter protein
LILLKYLLNNSARDLSRALVRIFWHTDCSRLCPSDTGCQNRPIWPTDFSVPTYRLTKPGDFPDMKQKPGNRKPLHSGIRSVLFAAHTTAVLALLTQGSQAVAEQSDTTLTTAASAQLGSRLEEILVTSRLRRESVQDVPIPLTVIGGDRLSLESVYTIDDLTRLAPGLTATTPNGRRTGISVRGIGKASGNDSMEAAVGVIVDDIFLSHVGMSYQDFTDLERVELLRGPQGTLLGKNTTMGAINYVSRQPSFERQVSYTAEIGASQHGSGAPGALRGNGSFSDALIEDTLAFRASFFVDRQQGDIENINPQFNDRFHEKNRYGGRVQFLLTPTENFRARLNLDAAASEENSNTKPMIFEPETFSDGTPRTTTYSSRLARSYFGGYTPVIGEWYKTDIGQAKPLVTRNKGASLRLDWDLRSHSLASITGYRDFFFDAVNDNEETRFDINTSGTLVNHSQFSQEFRLASDTGSAVDYQAGVFYLTSETDSTGRSRHGPDAGAFFANNSQYNVLSASSAGRLLLSQSLDQLYIATLTTPKTDSYAVFGQINWSLSDRARLTAGARNTYEVKDSTITKTAQFNSGSALTPVSAFGATPQEIAAATAIRAGRVGTVYAERPGDRIKNNAVSWLLSPQYQLNDDVLLYASAAYGEKSGSVQFNNSNGSPVTVDPEEVLNFELGVKSTWFDNLLTFNFNLYETGVEGYQSVTSLVDPTTTTGFRSQLGNIPKIRARGIEFEGGWLVSDSFRVLFGGAHNDARYLDWATATCPAEVLLTPNRQVCNNTGMQVVGAPRWSANLGLRYQGEIARGYQLQVFSNTVFRSSHNLESNLSSWGEFGSYSVTDGGIGLIFGERGSYEINLVAKNVFDKRYTTSVNDFSGTYGVGYDGIGGRRYLGLVLTGKI